MHFFVDQEHLEQLWRLERGVGKVGKLVGRYLVGYLVGAVVGVRVVGNDVGVRVVGNDVGFRVVGGNVGCGFVGDWVVVGLFVGGALPSGLGSCHERIESDDDDDDDDDDNNDDGVDDTLEHMVFVFASHTCSRILKVPFALFVPYFSWTQYFCLPQFSDPCGTHSCSLQYNRQLSLQSNLILLQLLSPVQYHIKVPRGFICKD
ncbi:hypothetical protein RFI_06547 [Reticulomyxa filosa]|uniref:Uncharacterized protein n=1 Tax=Reticulomyxa filosa TaxID=46433 RepID=X6NXG3_RETFI|nr:hypothetical protein RFI_06547 [Reticulomyxa filosa]|eukprot:ETO30573.1 hypothetical protein RFI_06547 [Reticulomyxa filosa]